MFGETDSTRTTFPLCFTLTGMSDIFPMGIQRPTKKRSGSVADAFYGRTAAQSDGESGSQPHGRRG